MLSEIRLLAAGLPDRRREQQGRMHGVWLYWLDPVAAAYDLMGPKRSLDRSLRGEWLDSLRRLAIVHPMRAGNRIPVPCQVRSPAGGFSLVLTMRSELRLP